MSPPKEFIPALGYHGLTPLYDLALRVTMGDPAFKETLLGHAALAPGMRVLDLGCGTATLTLLAQKRCAGIVLHALDADAGVLKIARAKAAQASAEIDFVEGYADKLPWPDGHFDLVISSLFFHHLTTPMKKAVFAEVRRVLRPGGRLLLVDWGKPQGLIARIGFFLLRCLDGFATTRDHAEGVLVQRAHEAGFENEAVMGSTATYLGTLDFLRCTR